MVSLLRDGMDSFKRKVNSTIDSATKIVVTAKEEYVDGSIAKVKSVADSTAQAVSDVATCSVSSVGARVMTFIDTGAAHSMSGVDTVFVQYQTLEDKLFDYLKGGVRSCLLNPYPTAAAALGLGVILLPGPRTLLFRHTFGKLQTDEAIYRNADSKLQNLVKSLEAHAKEAQALEEVAVQYAKEKYAIQSQLRDTSGSMHTLANEALKAERQAEGLKAILRQLPGRQALHLRSELSKVQSTAESQRAAVVRSLTSVNRALKS